jgi:hypothetical protein
MTTYYEYLDVKAQLSGDYGFAPLWNRCRVESKLLQAGQG